MLRIEMKNRLKLFDQNMFNVTYIFDSSFFYVLTVSGFISRWFPNEDTVFVETAFFEILHEPGSPNLRWGCHHRGNFANFKYYIEKRCAPFTNKSITVAIFVISVVKAIMKLS